MLGAMMLRFWNTLHRKLEDFEPLVPGQVGLYTCGPTVYYFAHIGNLRSYLFEDILVRTLLLAGYDVKRVMNITDVGHLVGDGDEGEDKVEREARRTGKTAWDIAKFYEEVFFIDFARLNMVPPTVVCRATEHIPEQIALVARLEKKGFVYRASDGMYFDTSKFPAYGSFSGQKLEDKEAGARVEQSVGKRQGSDFALWKFSPPMEQRQMEWPSPWGVGFPGWHIECSAMAKKYLDQPFDIHCGGIDHIPVHHENEIAQSEAAYDTPLARYWLHNEFITVDGQRMGKSLGNGYTVSELMERGFDPLAYRYLCLGAHYRSKLNFTWEALKAAETTLRKIQRWMFMTRMDKDITEGEVITASYERFLEVLANDLNTPQALAELHALLGRASSSATRPEDIFATIQQMDIVLGLSLSTWEETVLEIPTDVQALQAAREEARAQKNWAESDRLRDLLQEAGWTSEDQAGGISLLKRRSSNA